MGRLDVRAVAEMELQRREAPAVRHELRIIIGEEVFDRIAARAAESALEVGGILVGEVLADDAGPYVRVDAGIDALHAEAGGAELTLTHATWSHVHEEMDRRHAGQRIVGWYHTHPGFGVFLSDRDLFIHQSFFDLPFQIAFVYDSKSREHGVFVWRENRPCRARQYWVGARECLWDGAREDVPAAPRPAPERTDRPSSPGPAPPAAAAPEAGTAEPGGGRVAALACGAALLALVAGLAGWYLGAGSASTTEQSLQAELERARAQGAMEAVSSLEVDLLALLRKVVDDETSRAVDEAARAVDDALGRPAAGGTPGRPPDAAALARARDALARVAADRRTAQRVLDELGRLARKRGPDPAALARELLRQRTLLGALYAEVAAEAGRAGDTARVRRLLMAATDVDPGNYDVYQAQFRRFVRDGTLPRPGRAAEPAGPDAGRGTDSGGAAPAAPAPREAGGGS